MKKLMTIFGAILIASFIMTSCGGRSAKKENTDAKDSVTTPQSSTTDKSESTLSSDEKKQNAAANESSSTSDCDKFIKEYEGFVISYIKIVKEYKANPADMNVLNEYTTAAQKAAEMSNNAKDCNDPKYSAKLIELSNRLSKAAAGL